MSILRRARDHKLLDALDKLEGVSVNDVVWRAVRGDRDPLLGYASGGRWDPGLFDVIYTSFDPDGAIAELNFQLSRQPVFPSKVTFSLNEISVKTQNTLKFADLRELKPFGVDKDRYKDILYEKTQMIGDAAAFLGFDGIISPSARWKCLNLTIFSDKIKPDDLEKKSVTVIDLKIWKQKNNNNLE